MQRFDLVSINKGGIEQITNSLGKTRNSGETEKMYFSSFRESVASCASIFVDQTAVACDAECAGSVKLKTSSKLINDLIYG